MFPFSFPISVENGNGNNNFIRERSCRALDDSSPIKLMFPFPFLAEIGNGNGKINFIGELSSRAHFKGNIM